LAGRQDRPSGAYFPAVIVAVRFTPLRS
jgi:hypothetical protein